MTLQKKFFYFCVQTLHWGGQKFVDYIWYIYIYDYVEICWKESLHFQKELLNFHKESLRLFKTNRYIYSKCITIDTFIPNASIHLLKKNRYIHPKWITKFFQKESLHFFFKKLNFSKRITTFFPKRIATFIQKESLHFKWIDTFIQSQSIHLFKKNQYIHRQKYC